MAPGEPLAFKPTSQHLLRCKWADHVRFTPRHGLAVVVAVADALGYCHSVGVCHGDVYAHNCLVDEYLNTTLCDFGEAACTTHKHGRGRGQRPWCGFDEERWCAWGAADGCYDLWHVWRL